MSQDKYFRDELAFLREQGKEFSQLHPELARYLHGNHTDPDIERLLEGFAFLTGRLREKIDDDFPEFTHSMINMLWPNYLRPVPSYTIVRFTPLGSGITQRQTIAGATLLDSHPVDGQVCHFRTCRPLDVYPINLVDIHAVHSREASSITLEFKVESGQSLQQILLDSMEFYLGGQTYSAQMLYLWLNHYLDSIEFRCGEHSVSVPRSFCRAMGFEPSDSVLPYPKNVYDGYRVIQEYLTFPDAFRFFRVSSLSKIVPEFFEGDFSLRFHFTKTLPADVRINDDTFQLYCVPAINLFDHDADPIDLTGRKVEYPVMPSSRHPAHFEIFSIDRVEGWLEQGDGRHRGQTRLYHSFESFQHEVERSRHRTALYYRTRVKTSLRHEGLDHFLSFVRADETACVGVNECISLKLTCSNRQLPMRLGKGDICVATDNSPSFTSFENITEPSAPVRPVLDGSLLWTLISNLSLNYLSLLSRDAICSIIRSYDFRALVDRQAERVTRMRMDGIVAIESRPSERIIRGLPVRGLKTILRLDQQCFASEGDLYLFGAVLNRFFALYASINSFHELQVINVHNKESYTWDLELGQQPLI
ncbi:type VI secretion system baseplate subunit TssF [Shewanella khirikhana]|uniref:Type VI secretion protein n=1 Tax=Shewanella khirikhana TaxID=1965282 RepID=A0ABN5TUI2_9GAMM|nr:type VI secretion system baseplate subunit TssF [Shewanella khirikhana]AZQ10878.1 hypothetical protein STH12_01770 [Shewanella khirikhana]